MVGEIFQEILSSLSLAAIVVCLVTSTIYVLAPYFHEVGKSGTSNSTTDSVSKEELYEQKPGKFGLTRDLGNGRIIGLSRFEVLSKFDDHEEEELKGEMLDSGNAAEEDNKVFSGVLEELKKERVRVSGVQDVRGKVLDECSERPTLSEIKEERQRPVAETLLRYNMGDECGLSEAKREVVSEVLESDQLNKEKASYDEEKEGVLFDDWERIERTELEKLFGAAVAFVGSKSNADRLDSNVRLQLYGLHKIATVGPCHDPPPMALKLSARAKWNAWQRLGDMNAGMAMEQYMILLSDSIPEWEER